MRERERREGGEEKAPNMEITIIKGKFFEALILC